MATTNTKAKASGLRIFAHFIGKNTRHTAHTANMPDREPEAMMATTTRMVAAQAAFLKTPWLFSARWNPNGMLKASAEASPAGLSKLPQAGNELRESHRPPHCSKA